MEFATRAGSECARELSSSRCRKKEAFALGEARLEDHAEHLQRDLVQIVGLRKIRVVPRSHLCDTFLRAHQAPSEVFFSAYPNETVLNIANDRMLADALTLASKGRGMEALQRM